MKTYKFELNIEHIEVIGTEERIRRLMENDNIHPWYKNLRAVQLRRRCENMKNWTVLHDQKLVCYHNLK